MAPSYTFTLKPEKKASFSRIELLVVVLHLILFIVIAVSSYPEGIVAAGFGIAMAVIYVVLFFVYKNRQLRHTLLRLPLYFFLVWWFVNGVYWMAALLLVFNIFSTLSQKKIQIVFSQDQILYKSFPNRLFNWHNLNNAVLRDGLLTIDFKNDKLIQQLVEEDQTNEAAFNSFCQTQLKAAAGQNQPSQNT